MTIKEIVNEIERLNKEVQKEAEEQNLTDILKDILIPTEF